jgi:hypothetical protein
MKAFQHEAAGKKSKRNKRWKRGSNISAMNLWEV